MIPVVLNVLIQWAESKLHRIAIFVKQVDRHRRELSQQIVCQLAVSQFGGKFLKEYRNVCPAILLFYFIY